MIASVLAVAACGGGKKTKSVKGDRVDLVVPAATDVAQVSLASSYEMPEVLSKKAATKDHFIHIKNVDVVPHGRTIAGGGRLVLTIDPKEIPPGRRIDEMLAVAMISDTTFEDLPTKVVDGRLQIELTAFAEVAVLMPVAELELLGTPALVIRGTSEIMLGDCPSWITPTSPRVAELAPQLSIQAGTISLPIKLTAKRGDATTRQLRADEVLERGGGDSTNTSVLLASLLRARGHAVQLVAGHATYKPATKDGKTRRGYHQWVEVIVEGTPFYVDALDPATVWLRPLAEAQSAFSLVTHRTCAAYPPGHPDNRDQWVPAAGGAGSAAGSSAGSAAEPSTGSAAGSSAGSAAEPSAGSAAGSSAGSAAGSAADSSAGSAAGSSAGSNAGSGSAAVKE